MKKGYFAQKKRMFYVFVLPAAIYIAIMIVIPIFYNIVMSFRNIDLMNFRSGESVFIGLENYRELLTDRTFRTALFNTFSFTVWCLIFQFTIGFAMALLYSRKFRGAPYIRGIVVVAWMLPMIAVAGVFKFMFNSENGIINYLMMQVGLIQEPIQWLAHGNTAMQAIITANVWKGVPFNMILLATALTTLPTDIYESANLDGASVLQRFWYITLPLLKPAIISVLTLGFIYTFKVFDLVYVMTGGGPGSSTEMLSTLAYRYSFNDYNFSLGASAANVLFFLLMLVGLVYIRIVSKEDD